MMSDFTSSGRRTAEAGEPRPEGSRAGADPSPITADPELGVTHRVWIHPSRSMQAVSRQVEGLLDGLEKDQRRSGALLASELIAQVVCVAQGWNSEAVALTVQVRGDAVRLEAIGPAEPGIEATAEDGAAPDDPVADWGVYLIDRLASRWGLAGPPPRMIWAEIGARA